MEKPKIYCKYCRFFRTRAKNKDEIIGGTVINSCVAPENIITQKTDNFYNDDDIYVSKVPPSMLNKDNNCPYFLKKRWWQRRK